MPLIIAVPKSASTSLLRTISEENHLEVVKLRERLIQEPPVPGYEILGKYHAVVREVPLDLMPVIEGTDTIVREHLPPTDHNLELLAPLRPVVLTRSAADVVLAFRRAEESRVHGPKAEFEGCESEEDWLQRAEEIGLIAEIDNFCNGWVESGVASEIITFEQLVRESTDSVRRCQQALGLTQSANDIELKRYKYTRSSSRNLFRSAARRLKVNRLVSRIDL